MRRVWMRGRMIVVAVCLHGGVFDAGKRKMVTIVTSRSIEKQKGVW